MVQTLIYVSSATAPFSDEELERLLAQSRTANTARGVTGMLLYSDGNFIQILEGEPDTVETLYRKIARDPRHQDIMRLSSTTAESRQFPDWSMGYRRVKRDQLQAAIPGFNRFMEDRVGREAVLEEFNRAVRLFVSTFIATTRS